MVTFSEESEKLRLRENIPRKGTKLTTSFVPCFFQESALLINYRFTEKKKKMC